MSIKVHCTNCGKTGYGDIGKPPSGWYTKPFSSKMFCSNRCKDEFNGRNGSGENSVSETVVESQADRDVARAAKLEAKNQQRIQDLEEQKYLDAKAAKEKAERKAKADYLRSQGKNKRAIMVEYQNSIIGISLGVVFAIFITAIIITQSNKKADAITLNTELELIEDNVKLLINQGKYDEALVEVNKLIHPIHEEYKGKGTMFKTMYYDVYWDSKREEYKELIFNQNAIPQSKETQKETPKEVYDDYDVEIYEGDEGMGLNEGLGTEFEVEGLSSEYQR